MNDIHEEVEQPSELQGFLECKKVKDNHARIYDYHKRYDEYCQDDDYYERRCIYDESLRFNPKLDI